MPTELSRVAMSIEYVEASVSANINLGSQTVGIAVMDAGVRPTIIGDFTVASWVDDAAPVNTARIAAADLDPGTYDIFVRIDNSPEIPVLYAGRLTAT